MVGGHRAESVRLIARGSSPRSRQTVLLSSLPEPEAIRYRQAVLTDCLEHSAIVRQLYDLAVEALESKKKAHVFLFRDSPDALLQKSARILELLADVLRRLRGLVDEHAAAFGSDGFTRLFARLQEELDDAYLQTVEHHLRELRFRRGALKTGTLRKPCDARRLAPRPSDMRKAAAKEAPVLSQALPRRGGRPLWCCPQNEFRSR